MKNKESVKKTDRPHEIIEGFKTVEFFRTVKEKIAKETEGMTFEQFKTYLSKRTIKTAE